MVSVCCCAVAYYEWGTQEKELGFWMGIYYRGGGWHFLKSWFGCSIRGRGNIFSGKLLPPGTGPFVFLARLVLGGLLLFSLRILLRKEAWLCFCCWELSQLSIVTGQDPNSLTSCYQHSCLSSQRAGEASYIWAVPLWAALLSMWMQPCQRLTCVGSLQISSVPRLSSDLGQISQPSDNSLFTSF